jgi:hypothetical protein
MSATGQREVGGGVRRPQLAFRELMAGWFAVGATDPRQGAARGRAARTRLALHGTIAIDDLARFATSPDHQAVLRGGIRFPALGGEMPGSGRVELFVAHRADGERRMVYELACQGAAGPLYFAGEKEVVRRSPLWIWRDTTTLYSRLHRGTDRSGEVVAAGILRLSPWQLVRMLGTFRARPLGGLARFGLFFGGQLWSTYVRRRPAVVAGNGG